MFAVTAERHPDCVARSLPSVLHRPRLGSHVRRRALGLREKEGAFGLPWSGSEQELLGGSWRKNLYREEMKKECDNGEWRLRAINQTARFR